MRRRSSNQPAEASLLFVRPGTDRGALAPWDPGRYRVDLVVADGIHRMSVLVPDTHGVVPPLETWTPARPTSTLLSWGEVASAISSHDSWGVRVVTVDQRGFNPATGPSSFHELWSAATPIDGVETAIVGTYVDPLSLLGITVPQATGARAVRIWRVHRDDQLEWVDAVPLAAQPSDAATLFIRPGVDGAALTPWQPGRYRVDVLGSDGIHHLAVLVPDPFGVVPPLDTWAQEAPTIAARDSDPSGVRIGLFATVDGVGVSLPARETRPLDDDAAWRDLSEGANDVVATAYLPRASGLGVMLTSHAAVSSATIQRLAPEVPFDAPEATGGISESHGRTPYVLFTPVGRDDLGAGCLCHLRRVVRRGRRPRGHLARGAPARRRIGRGLGYPSVMPRLLSRKVPIAELHCHLGGAVTPAIMWGIAHSQGIKLPTKDYWEFRDMITVSPRRNRSFDGYLQLFHWTELIQSSPLAVERSVYEVVGGAYRKNNVTTMELRFNPMKRNRGGEQDLDHIIAAALRGMDKASLEYPVKPGLIFCLDRAFPYELNEILVEKAITWRDRGVVGVDIAGPESATFRVADYSRLFRRARQFGLGLTVHTGEAGPVEEVARVVELLEPDRIGHGVKAAYDPRAMAMIRDRGIVLEICPTSNLNTRVVSGWEEFRWIFDTLRRNEVRFTINTDGPEMLKTYVRDEMAQLGRLGILSVADQEVAAATSLAASFVPNVSDVPAPRLEPASRVAVEREEA